MATLDRILVSVEWEAKYPMAKVNILPKEVSGHNPVMINRGGTKKPIDPIFRFEKWWLEVAEFPALVRKVWDTECLFSDPMDRW